MGQLTLDRQSEPVPPPVETFFLRTGRAAFFAPRQPAAAEKRRRRGVSFQDFYRPADAPAPGKRILRAHRPRHRYPVPHWKGPARAHCLSSQGGKNDVSKNHLPGPRQVRSDPETVQPPGRRAAGGGHRFPAQRPRRSPCLLQRPPLRRAYPRRAEPHEQSHP